MEKAQVNFLMLIIKEKLETQAKQDFAAVPDLKSIDDYIKFASPITSGAVHDNHLKEISSATLRNELNALEAMGYLKQLHTSSGRIPTSKAYRFFVNEIMKTTKFDKKSLATVREIFSQRSESLTEIVNQLAGIISEATNYPTFVVLNSYKGLIVENIKIIKLIDGNASISDYCY